MQIGLFTAAILLGGACSDQLPTAPLQDRPQLNISEGDGPKIATDKVDYAPGETVIIDGWDWTPGETVRLQVAFAEGDTDPGNPAFQPWDVTADVNGHVASSWLVPAEAADATLKLTADGQTSGAHAELLFTDLTGTVLLYADAAFTVTSTAYPWGAAVYPRLTGGSTNNCYQIQWRDPSNAVVASETFGPSNPADFSPLAFVIPATGPSGTWSAVVAQNTAGNCAGPFSSAAQPFLFDVARAVIVGAGTTADDAVGGDQCVYAGTPPFGSCAVTDVNLWVRSHSAGNVHTFLRFDLAAALPEAVPAGATITDAKVRLTLIGTPGQDRQYDIQRTSGTWEEGSLGAFPGPATTGTIATTTILATALTPANNGGDPQTWYKWSVTADVQGFIDGAFTNHGWRISDQAQNAASPRVSRFISSEDPRPRARPVLLIDYVPGPTKLAFTTGPFTRRVGECIGPMTVQSQDDASAALAVTTNTTVGLSSDNGTTGAGAFFSNSTCTTGIASVQINSGSYDSPNFYYRATGRGDGTHELTADDTNPDRLTSATQTQTIDKALTTLIYTGDPLVLIGNTLHLKAVLTSDWAPCIENKRIIWGMTPDPNGANPPNPIPPSAFVFFTNSFTDASGVATRDVSTTDWIEGIYDGRASFPGDADCEASKDDPAITVLAPGNAATGGGFLAGNKVGGGRVNFGFNVRPIQDSAPLAYKGQFLLIKRDGDPVFRCKGAIDTYGTVNGVSVASGRCDYQIWNPTLDGGLGDWEVPYGPGYTDRQFIIEFIDNGEGKGKNAPPPDEFGFNISFVGAAPDPSFARAPINGGNIDTKGGAAQTTSGGGKKK